MSKNKKNNNYLTLLNNFADAGRAEFIRVALKDWDEKNIFAGTATEHLLAKLLNVDVSWVFMFNEVITGKAHGAMLWGAEQNKEVQLAQALMVQKHGTISHPLFDNDIIHPKIKHIINTFIKHPSKRLP